MADLHPDTLEGRLHIGLMIAVNIQSQYGAVTMNDQTAIVRMVRVDRRYFVPKLVVQTGHLLASLLIRMRTHVFRIVSGNLPQLDCQSVMTTLG